MRALVLPLLLLVAVQVPTGATASETCLIGRFHQVGHEVTCERDAPDACHVVLSNDTAGPLVDQSAPCLPDQCIERSASNLVKTDCERITSPDGTTHRRATIDIHVDPRNDMLPGAHVQVRLTRFDDGESSTSTCRVQYERISGPSGPENINAGRNCVYPFLLA